MKITDNKNTTLKNFTKVKHNIIDMKVKYQNANRLSEEIGLPKKNEAIYCWLQGNFVFGDFFVQYIIANNMDVEELTIISLSISYETIEALEALIDNGWVKKINLMISGYFVRTEKAKHTKSIELLNGFKERKGESFNLSTTNTHQKIALFKTKNSKFVIHGSANMKGSQNYEQIMIENNSALYNFNKEYFDNLVNK